MSKKMTRKGLAFGAGFALVASGLASVPAQAALESGISLGAHYGQSDELVAVQDLTHGIVLATELTSIGNTDASKLKYLVEIVQTSDLDEWGDIDGTPDFNTIYASQLADGTTDQFKTAGNDATVTTPEGSTTSRVVTPANMGTTRSFGITSGAMSGDSNVSDAAGNTDDVILVVPGHDFAVADVVNLATGAVSNTTGPEDLVGAYTVTGITGNSITLEGNQLADITETNDEAVTLATGAVVTGKSQPSASETNLLFFAVPDQELDGTATDHEPISFNVTAWVDNNSNGVIDANEYSSGAKIVTFVAQEDVLFVHNVDFFTVGDTTLGGNWYADGVNTRNLTAVMKENSQIGFEVEADDATVGAKQKTDNTDGTAVGNATHAYNATFDRYDWAYDANGVGAIDESAAAIEAEAYSFALLVDDGADKEPGDADGAGVYFISDAGTASGNLSDTSITSTASASGLNKAEIVVDTSTTISQNATNAGNSLIEEAESVEALTGTTSIPFTVDLYTGATTRAGSGIEVEVTIKDVANALDTTTLTVEGKTLTAITAANQVSFTAKTNSSGQVAFTIEADIGADGESFTIDARAGDKSIDTTTVQWANRDFKLLQTPDTNFKIDTQGSVVAEYQVVDQFGEAPVGDYQLAFTRARTSGDRTVALGTVAEWSYVAPVSETGRSTVTITDNGSSTAEGVDTVTATLQKAATAGTGYVGTDDTDTFTVTYETDLDGMSATATVNNNGVLVGTTSVFPVSIETVSLVDFDSRLGSVDPEYTDTNTFNDRLNNTADDILTVSGTVTDSDNDGIAGVAVELSAEGLNFADANTSAGSTLMLNNSVVVVTDANGDYEAFVRSSVSGKQTVNVNAQGAKASVDVTFEGSTGTADAMTLQVASAVVDGRTSDVKVTVLDKLGNPVSGVAVTFKETGPGYLNTNSGTTDADGEVMVNLITLEGDTGSSTITASATIGLEATSVAKTITVGAVASAQKVNAGSFKGYVALYAKGYEGQRMSAKVGKDWVIVAAIPAAANDLFRAVEFVGAGVEISVRLYIDRVLIDTIPLVTK